MLISTLGPVYTAGQSRMRKGASPEVKGLFTRTVTVSVKVTLDLQFNIVSVLALVLTSKWVIKVSVKKTGCAAHKKRATLTVHVNEA